MPDHKQYFPNAFETMGNTYFVARDNPNASDENSGAAARPFKTIAKAASVVDMGDVVIIDEGTYREEVPIIRHGHQYQPDSFVVFKAAPGKMVYLKGSDVFEPDWEDLGRGVHQAALPEALFRAGVYNPYALSCVIDEPRQARPNEGPTLPETLGQIYVDGDALDQLDSVQAVHDTPGSFVVSADGKDIIVHFADGNVPKDRLVELTVRERCFRPSFSGPIFIGTMGIVVEHAADPGAFCYCRPLSIRSNPVGGPCVRKSFVRRSTIKSCGIMGWPSYKSKDRPTIIASVADDTEPGPSRNAKLYTVESEDGGKTWQAIAEASAAEQSTANYFFDEEKGMLVRHVLKHLGASDLDGAYGARRHEILLDVSADGGSTWSEPQQIDHGSYYYRMIKLHDGSLLWPYTDSQIERGYHSRFNVRLGKWRDDLSGIDWVKGGSVEIDPRKCSSGLDEPQACQFPDGRIFVLIRAGNVLPTQDTPGVPSVKLFIVSEDGGKTWSEPAPLTYEDGRYVYSPRSYPDVVCSAKNNKVYVLLNISGTTVNCDPRTTLNIAELNTDTLCVKKDTVAIIETRHEEHRHLVRFSNWVAMEDRDTKNLILFMKLHMSEYCPVRKGYDFSLYRYEIEFPE